jgi:guanylate kinase
LNSQGVAKPRLIIVSAPSGAGKTSLARALIASSRDVVLSVSHTTRAPRPGELDGRDYHFVDREVFHEMVARGDFLEYAEVFGNYYGTAREAVNASLDNGLNVLLDIDWQGARKVRERLPESFSVFILPPSLETLRDRLNRRGQDSEEVIDSRMRDAIAEMSHYDEYDRVIVNRDFDKALHQLQNLVAGGEDGIDPADIDFKALVSVDKTVTLAG